MATSPSTQRLYFAYGSNLSLAQMSRRCLTSTYHSLGHLSGFKWVISPRGYANVIKSPADSGNERDEVYGLLYKLEAEDEKALDIAEGVPHSYVKMMLTVTSTEAGTLFGGKRSKAQALVYVDMMRTGEGVCKEEYVARMNRGISDAVEKGMPESYVKDVLRKWIRDEEVPPEVDDPFAPAKK